MRTSAPLAALCLVLLLGGCASVRQGGSLPVMEADAQRAWLQQVESFDLAGRVAAAVGEEGFSAQLDLEQRGELARLELRSPLGFGSARVETDGRTLNFRSSRGEQFTGDEGLRALAARLGFEPPLASLRYWLMGVPDPAQPVTPLVEGGAGGFEQLGWRVRIDETRPVATPRASLLLPRRVTLERTGVRLRVLVERWNLRGS